MQWWQGNNVIFTLLDIVELLKSCGNKSTTDVALFIEVHKSQHADLSKDACTLTVKTTQRHHFLINIESFTLGKKGNCSDVKPRLDLCTNKTDCFGMYYWIYKYTIKYTIKNKSLINSSKKIGMWGEKRQIKRNNTRSIKLATSCQLLENEKC